MKGIATDFDGTAFKTFEASPGGVGVNEAYVHAIELLFGTRAMSWYQRHGGGHQNGAPSEIVHVILEAGDRDALLARAQHLAGSDPITAQLDWRRDDGVFACTELLIELKLRPLMSQIGARFPDGTMWPRPMPGFCEYWQRLSSDQEVCTLVLSSGHRSFIERTFALYGLPQPDVMVTDDDVRDLPEPFVKPDPRLLEMGLWKLRCEFGDVEPVVFYGDDPEKDGGLARAFGVPFGHISLGESDEALSFSNWEYAPFPYGLVSG